MSVEFGEATGVCHKELLANFIADGFDSRVYRDGDFVKRVYVGPGGGHKPPTVETLALYLEITNRAAEMSNNEEFVFNFPFSKEKYLFKVIPFKEMYKCSDCGSIEAVSLYVPGKNLITPSDQFDHKELEVVLRAASNTLEDRLGVKGIGLEASNLKSPGKGIIIVTDICANVADLRRKRW